MVTETLHHRHPHHGSTSNGGHSPSISTPASDTTTTMMMNGGSGGVGVGGTSSSSSKDVGTNNSSSNLQQRRRRKRRSSSRNKKCNNNIFFCSGSSKNKQGGIITLPNLNLSNFKLGIWSSRVLLMFVAIIYSTNFACVRYLETSDGIGKPHDPAEISFCRFFVSAIVCLPILYQNRRYIEVIKSGIEVGFWCSVHYVCQANSLEYIAAGKCSFICALEVVTVPLFAGFFLKKPIRPMSLISAAIAIFGVGVLEQLIPLPLFISSHVSVATAAINHPVGPARFMGVLGKGDMLALVQPLAFGYAMMRIEYHVERFAHIPNRVLTLTAAQCITVFVSTFLWVLYNGHGHMPDFSYMEEPHRILTLFWTGAITTVLAIILQGIALQTASATDAALIFSGDPLWSSLFAGWLLNERPTISTYVGGAFILTGCVIGSIASAKNDEASSHHNYDNTTTINSNKNPYHQHRRKLKLKDSFIESDQESLLPHSYDSSANMSMESINDVRQFPVSV